ncbi:unnamed protein product, partial [Prunus brigantina]
KRVLQKGLVENEGEREKGGLRILGSQCPFPTVAQVKNPYSQPSPFLSFLPSFMVRSDEGKKLVYMLVRRVAPCAPISFGLLDILFENLILPSQQPCARGLPSSFHGFVSQPNAEAFCCFSFLII